MERHGLQYRGYDSSVQDGSQLCYTVVEEVYRSFTEVKVAISCCKNTLTLTVLISKVLQIYITWK